MLSENWKSYKRRWGRSGTEGDRIWFLTFFIYIMIFLLAIFFLQLYGLQLMTDI